MRPVPDRQAEREAPPLPAEPARPSPAAPRSVQMLLALQRSAGNHAVSGLVARQHTAEKAAPRVAHWTMRVVEGGEGAGIKRGLDPPRNKLFKGDKAIVAVQFVKPVAEGEVQLIASAFGKGAAITGGRWADRRTREWELTFSHVGDKEARFEVGGDEDVYEEKFTIVADLHDFTLGCVQAQSRVSKRFAAASRHVNLAASAFRKAHAEQDTDLKDVEAEERMWGDLVWGALFAAAGGFVGGGVGGWLKTVKEGAFKNDDWLIDTAKDTAKFAVRSIDRVQRGGRPATAGDSTAPGHADVGRARGERRASGKDPLDFLTDLSADIAAEGEALHARLEELIGSARQARDANSKADFEEDPLDVVSRGYQLEQLVAGLHLEKKLYLKQLWKTWLENYAWKAEVTTLSAEPNVNRKLRKKIAKAAADCGESADAWISEFGRKAKVKAEAEAEELKTQYWGAGLP